MTDIKKYVTRMSIARGNNSPIFGESSLSIEVDDEAGGWFFVITDHEDNKIKLDLDELRVLLQCAEEMAKQEPSGHD